MTLFVILQIASYYEIDADLMPSVGLAKRIGTETYKFVENQDQMQQDQMYYLKYRTHIEVDHLASPHWYSNVKDSNIRRQVKLSSTKMLIENIIVCPYYGCSMEFKEVGNLKSHIITHTKERPYKCTICVLSF